MTPPVNESQWRAALASLHARGLAVEINRARMVLAIVPAGTTFKTIPSAQWQPGLSPTEAVALAHDAGALAAYLARPWPQSWLDRQRQPAPLAGQPPIRDLDDPWSDAPRD